MSRIRIRNFGPIKDGLLDNNGWIDIRKVTLFIGNQGSGKSTAAKLISVFTKIEKSLVRGDFEKSWFETKNRLKSYFLPYHRLEDYHNDISEIEYEGDRFSITYKDERISIREVSNSKYSLPKIMYVPAERNFLAYIKGTEELKLSSDALQEFSTEYYSAIEGMNARAIPLPISDTEIRYDKRSGELYLKSNDFRIKLRVASSGFQSFVPLYLVSDYLANSVKQQSGKEKVMSSEETVKFQKGLRTIWNNDYLTDTQKRQAISELASVFNKTAFVNIVEEPEQNLYPSSQWQMLQSLLALNNMTADNKLIVTTHSPYLMNYLTIAIKAKQVFDNLLDSNRERLSSKIAKLISLDSYTNADEVFIYEIKDKTGLIKLLPKYNGIIPSDNNFLNDELAKINNLFAELQEIEDENEN